ncbi:MAG TPA: hypothetical protein VFI65_02815 [Streptosporangiaceae bacterium]|nr:hypothetical protein [Streptosporangiaceae bacterium]
MRWPDTAIARRNDLLARTRRLTLLVVGAASAASIGLATVLGLSIPGKAATTGAKAPSGPNPTASPAPGRHGTNPRTNPKTTHGTRHHHGRSHLAPPTQPPSSSQAPPTTSSGGS